ncbi:hypothetical protein EST62_09505 [Chlorobaculum sp. 24CR]|uniref:hypothetical protein n=1 Tax=Chlorobaculum sp. 24CR TaxID=2508878 RepID=UPI00100A38A6|nr:hypothetical protein [Chlorobaculum sp. 24CR]RXK84541.1 hypothetical protein EST62_09505 [Chlorobaculum sp. 24CR]
MTREERIDALKISDADKEEFKKIFFEYEDKYDRSGPDLRCWWLNQVLPISQRLLEERYTSRQEVKCLFVLVGTTIEPLFLSILTIRPQEKIYLISSCESVAQSEYISNSLRQIHGGGDLINPDLFSDNVKRYLENIKNIEIYTDVVIKNISPQKVFSAIRERVGMYAYDDVGVDVTGGKKSMTGGGYLVAAINNLHLFYVDFDEYTDKYPKPGTEFLNKLDNPYEIYNIDSVSQAIKLFKQYNYSAANEIFKQTICKLTDDIVMNYEMASEKTRIENMQKAAECYMYWDRYEYSEIKKEILPQIQLNLLCDDKYYKVLDYLLNAERRFNQGYYNDAILRLLQVVESLLVVNSGKISQAINKSVKNEKLRSGLHEIRMARNAFAHKNKTLEKSIYIEGFSNVKQLICDLFEREIGEVEAE